MPFKHVHVLLKGHMSSSHDSYYGEVITVNYFARVRCLLGNVQSNGMFELRVFSYD